MYWMVEVTDNVLAVLDLYQKKPNMTGEVCNRFKVGQITPTLVRDGRPRRDKSDRR
jgi:hypothetical protein